MVTFSSQEGIKMIIHYINLSFIYTYHDCTFHLDPKNVQEWHAYIRTVVTNHILKRYSGIKKYFSWSISGQSMPRFVLLFEVPVKNVR